MSPQPLPLKPRATGVRRVIYLTVAYLSIGLALLGVVLPGLPTTEFVLLSAWCAVRSSDRLSHWLYSHRIFGPLLISWQRDGLISRKTKFVASASMLFAVALLLWHQPPLWLMLLAIGGMSCGALWIWSRPERLRG